MFAFFLNTDRSGPEPVKVLTVVIDGEPKTISGEMVEKTIQAIRDNDEDLVRECVDIALSIKNSSNGLFEVIDNVVHIDGKPVPEVLSNKILDYYNEDVPYGSLINFWHRLNKNPSFRSVQCLYAFLEHNSVPLTDDGCFIAYKGVNANFTDCHTGTIDNSPGKTVAVSRNDVDDNPERTCSKGLHVAGWNYASGTAYGGAAKYLEIKVDPEHVVAVPSDYNFQKMRVCQYYVVKEVNKPSNILVVSGPEYNCDDDDGYDDEDDYDDEDEYGDNYEEEDPYDDELDPYADDDSTDGRGVD